MDDNLGDVTLGNLFSFLDAKESFNCYFGGNIRKLIAQVPQFTTDKTELREMKWIVHTQVAYQLTVEPSLEPKAWLPVWLSPCSAILSLTTAQSSPCPTRSCPKTLWGRKDNDLGAQKKLFTLEGWEKVKNIRKQMTSKEVTWSHGCWGEPWKFHEWECVGAAGTLYMSSLHPKIDVLFISLQYLWQS